MADKLIDVLVAAEEDSSAILLFLFLQAPRESPQYPQGNFLSGQGRKGNPRGG
jgi:hypothetical protein